MKVYANINFSSMGVCYNISVKNSDQTYLNTSRTHIKSKKSILSTYIAYRYAYYNTLCICDKQDFNNLILKSRMGCILSFNNQ